MIASPYSFYVFRVDLCQHVDVEVVVEMLRDELSVSRVETRHGIELFCIQIPNCLEPHLSCSPGYLVLQLSYLLVYAWARTGFCLAHHFSSPGRRSHAATPEYSVLCSEGTSSNIQRL